MFGVLVMGATVTTTGSAQGCGRDWPLCNGRLVPDFALAAAIEFSHRAVTAVEGVLIVAFTIVVLLLYRRQRPALFLAPLMLGSLLLQAGMGAWAVMYPQQPVVLALHFGISLIALATTALTALYLRRPGAMLAVPAAGRSVRLATWSAAAYLYVVVYSGAFVRHVGGTRAARPCRRRRPPAAAPRERHRTARADVGGRADLPRPRAPAAGRLDRRDRARRRPRRARGGRARRPGRPRPELRAHAGRPLR